ncbi:DNA sulfur modification protein DndB [Microcoleus sp. ZQ-A2]|nr:DNA sulfur modification protein DndB [Microcoleus sp. FACHB-1]
MPIPSFEYVLPVIRGIQAGREYYISMCPVRFIPKLFAGNDEEVLPEMRARRTSNKTRVPEIARYILDNRKNYTFSAITASIDADITFEPIGTEAEARKIGRLRVPMDARFAIHDGNHRRAAFELALSENPELGYETIALILFLDIGLKRSQQMCLDLNRNSVPLDPSLTILYDHRDEKASLVRAVIKEVPVFRTLTDMERSTLPSRSGKLFTLSSVYNATLALLADCQNAEVKNPPDSPLKGGMLEEQLSKQIELAAQYWNTVTRYIPDWEQVLEKKVSAGEVRRDYVHCHAIALSGLGRVGASLISIYPEGWDEHLGGLAGIDWSRSHPDWQGRIMSKGGISQSQTSVSRMTAYIKKYLDLPLTLEEEGLENASVAVGGEK